MKRRVLLAAAAAMGVAALPLAAMAQVYPTKPITVIVPFAAGGPTDALARVLTARMGEALGQTMIVENVGGAGGTIGVNKAAKATPDGYTILFAHMGTLAVNIALYKTLPYDSQKDFEPIGLGGTNPMVLVAKKDLPAKDFKEFEAYLKANQKKAQYGMAGIGAASHLGGLMLNSMMKVDVLEIPYKGTGPALNDLVSGQFDYMVDQAVNVLPQIKAGTIKALGVSTLKRLPQLPDVPTVDESGLKGYEVTIWNGFFVAKNTPKNVIDTLNKALVTALGDEKVRARLIEQAVDLPEPKDATPAALAAQLKASIDKWVPAIKAAGVQPQ
ncbi:tripartite tricarboxylate transporter substrate binding protein BugD [Reyranella sp. MMS21-HV4-11]|jgi:tripartite-type tricarboxylate transporter receptor subunit TctC|uniref:Tripartite tricarboxylate transporter substrate binding protein BugD n=1 Tax=Reyranella humidisoli TaxID=2849149 RepID=A0ABS6IT39_9HYPH|nr:tripartite tricarboxylate transporter substrate-binding protein [Reyranella sp. MMS21-HV4-11]MBU8877189.1 tripartite tricarboxylate transporter substrate binding protein BugD [Reyranella sp. MMS21-HV4-11]